MGSFVKEHIQITGLLKTAEAMAPLPVVLDIPLLDAARDVAAVLSAAKRQCEAMLEATRRECEQTKLRSMMETIQSLQRERQTLLQLVEPSIIVLTRAVMDRLLDEIPDERRITTVLRDLMEKVDARAPATLRLHPGHKQNSDCLAVASALKISWDESLELDESVLATSLGEYRASFRGKRALLGALLERALRD